MRVARDVRHGGKRELNIEGYNISGVRIFDIFSEWNFKYG